MYPVAPVTSTLAGFPLLFLRVARSEVTVSIIKTTTYYRPVLFLTEATRNVILGLLLGWVGENLFGFVVFD